jgi:N-acetylglucosamine kinase-like BadF-type ATPase
VTTSYKIGVDGGGSKTELILVDAAGAIVARHAAPGCNPSLTGPAQARQVLVSACAELLAAARLPSPVTVVETHLYMAGNPAFWEETAASLAGFGRVRSAPDSVPVLELATGGRPGLVLHAGTGSFVAARTADGGVHYAGGLGWKIGDPGSGYDLGRRGIAQALLELQGWAPASGLGAALQAHTGLADAGSITRKLYAEQTSNGLVAGFAPRVIEAAAGGCVPAQAALVASLGELLDQGRLVTARLFALAGNMPCGVSGAILNSTPARAALLALAETRRWPVDLHFITEPPIEGVRRLLART